MPGGHKADGQQTTDAGAGTDVMGEQWQRAHRGGSKYRLRTQIGQSPRLAGTRVRCGRRRASQMSQYIAPSVRF